jgi:hypothetical protein
LVDSTAGCRDGTGVHRRRISAAKALRNIESMADAGTTARRDRQTRGCELRSAIDLTTRGPLSGVDRAQGPPQGSQRVSIKAKRDRA